jgi:hypothetical protein
MENLNKLVHDVAVALLDDDHGINSLAYGYLRELLIATSNDEIIQHVDATDDRFYLKASYPYEG